MTNKETVTLSRAAYDTLINRNNDLEDRLAAVEADDGSRVPHEVAVAIIRGESPMSAFRAHPRRDTSRSCPKDGYIGEPPIGDRAGTQSGLRYYTGPHCKSIRHYYRLPCHRIEVSLC